MCINLPSYGDHDTLFRMHPDLTHPSDWTRIHQRSPFDLLQLSQLLILLLYFVWWNFSRLVDFFKERCIMACGRLCYWVLFYFIFYSSRLHSNIWKKSQKRAYVCAKINESCLWESLLCEHGCSRTEVFSLYYHLFIFSLLSHQAYDDDDVLVLSKI
jgi:hypothetical protein